ncbi:Type 2A phosphatase-associated protein 42 [Pseudozyma hubeiensis]|nr:Type 2A phosphatase-associated protein 42 [Pseudozyma hubeiensis]
MSGQTLNDLIASVFLRASDPPPPPPPQAFDPRAPETSTSASASSSSSAVDPAEATLSLLSRAQQLSDSIGVISPNDALRDISTSSLRTLFLPSLQSELQTAVRTGTDHSARKQRLVSSQHAAATFLNRTLALGVVPPTTKQLLGWTLANVPVNELTAIGLDSSLTSIGGAPPHAREVKISLFKLERALKSNLEQFRDAYQAKIKLESQVKVPADVGYDLLLYPRSRSTEDDDEEDDDDDEDQDLGQETPASAPGGISSVRQYLLAQLNLHSLKTTQLITSASQELELLRSLPPPPPPNTSQPHTTGEEWRLDRPPSSLPTTGPLLAPTGKVLRPFTITPSSNRSSIASRVFQPSHRLPTMSIDEYLEEEQRRGNIIQGGGQASYDAPTSTEQRQLRAEMDGTRDAEDAEEEQRTKDLQWDAFSEENRKGAGNTMNRG